MFLAARSDVEVSETAKSSPAQLGHSCLRWREQEPKQILSSPPLRTTILEGTDKPLFM